MSYNLFKMAQAYRVIRDYEEGLSEQEVSDILARRNKLELFSVTSMHRDLVGYYNFWIPNWVQRFLEVGKNLRKTTQVLEDRLNKILESSETTRSNYNRSSLNS